MSVHPDSSKSFGVNEHGLEIIKLYRKRKGLPTEEGARRKIIDKICGGSEKLK